MIAEALNAFIGVITRYRLPAGWHLAPGFEGIRSLETLNAARGMNPDEHLIVSRLGAGAYSYLSTSGLPY
jgi:hypothetical protein